jgi:hypothetical protein
VAGTFAATGPGVRTPNAAVDETGWYVFQLNVPGDSPTIGLETPCNDVANGSSSRRSRRLTTVSSDSVTPSTPIFDPSGGRLAGTGGR